MFETAANACTFLSIHMRSFPSNLLVQDMSVDKKSHLLKTPEAQVYHNKTNN